MSAVTIREVRHCRNLTRTRRLTRARTGGLRKCPDCKASYLPDGSPLHPCPACRGLHLVACRDCGEPFHPDSSGPLICDTCFEHFTIWH